MASPSDIADTIHLFGLKHKRINDRFIGCVQERPLHPTREGMGVRGKKRKHRGAMRVVTGEAAIAVATCYATRGATLRWTIVSA
jgi:hypothetical protein